MLTHKNNMSGIVVALTYLIITLVMTWPAYVSLGSNVLGLGGDAWQTMWRFEEKDQAFMAAKESGSLRPYIAAEFLGFSGPHLVNASVWPWMWLHLLAGQPLAYNIIWVSSFVFSGLGMYYLVRVLATSTEDEDTLVSRAPAFIAGLFYMFLPFHIAHAGGHFGAMQTQWLPWIFAIAILAVRKPTIGRAIVLSMLVIIQGWSEHHYLLWLGIVTGIAVIWWRKAIIDSFKTTSSTTKVVYGVMAILAVGIVGATYLPTARLSLQEDSYINLGRDQLIRFSGDLFSYVTPAPFHPIWGDFFYALFAKSFTGNISESTLYVGIIPLLLILFFHQSIPHEQKRFWVVLGAVFFLITLGPRLHVFGNVTSIPLPYELIDELPGISSVRAVTRAAVIVNIAIAVLLGWILKAQLHRKGSAVALSAIILLEFLFYPVPVQSTQLSHAYESVRGVSGSTIIEIPAATNYTAASKALYAQHIHNKEVLGSIALERALSQDAFELPKSVPAVRQLLYLRTTDIRERRTDFFNQTLTETFPDALHFFDVGAILIHKDSLSPLQYSSLDAFIEESLNIEAQHFDDVALYLVPERTLQNADGVFLMRDGAWEGVGFDPMRNSIFAEIVREATVTIVNTRVEDAQVELKFGIAPESVGTGRIIYNGRTIAQIDSTTSEQSLTLELSPGEHTVQFIPESSEKIIIQNPTLQVLETAL